MGTVIGSDIEINVDKNYKGKITDIYGNSTQEVIEAVAGKTVIGYELEITDADLTKENQLLIEGHSKQETTEGNQLWGGFQTYNFTNNGIDFSMNENGTVSMSGTSTGNATLNIAQAINNGISLKLPAGTYTVSKDTINTNYKIQIYDSTSNFIAEVINAQYSNSFILNEEKTIVIRPMVSNGNTVNLVAKVMLNAGDTALPWEKYTGGQPSPNPNYESEVNSVGDNVNEFDIGTSESDYDVSSSISVQGGVFNVRGNKIEMTVIRGGMTYVWRNTTYNKKGTFTISTKASEPYCRYFIKFRNNDNTDWLTSDDISIDGWTYNSVYHGWFVTTNDNNFSKTISIPNGNWSYWQVGIGFDSNPTYVGTIQNIYDIKIEKGTVATPYSPYGMGCASIEKVNKNLAGLEIDGGYRSYTNGNKQTNSSYNGYIAKVNPQNNYICSFDISSGSYSDISNLVFFDKNMNFISGQAFQSLNKNFTTPEKCEYVTIAVAKTIADFMLEPGSTATPYTPHQSKTYEIYTQQPMRSNGEVRDDFSEENERHKIARKIFDGTENWENNQNIFYLKVADKVNSKLEVLSNSYTWSNKEWQYLNNYEITTQNGNNVIFIKNTDYDNVNDFKAYLATQYANGNPVYVDYVLAEPLLLPCTNEQIEVLNEMKDGELYEDYTNITSLDDIQPYLNFHYNFVTPAPSPNRESEVYSVADNNGINIVIRNANNTESQNFTITTQQPMRSIGEVRDDFVKQAGVKYERHKIVRYIFTGNEFIDGGSSDGGTSASKRFYLTHNLTNLVASSSPNTLMCSNFNIGPTYGTDNTLIQLGTTVFYLRININDYSNLSTKEQLKAWLKAKYDEGNPVYVDYVLAEPLLLPCTNEQVEQLEALQNILLYTGINHITNINTPQATMVLEYYKLVEDYDFYISAEGFLIVPKSNIKYKIDPIESSIPSMPEASETSVRVAGTDGDVPLMTTYEPIPFNIVCYTEDNLTPEEKIEEEHKLDNFINTIKNNTKQLAFENEEKLYNVKYNGALTAIRYPKHIKFSIPLKSSKPFAKYFVERREIGTATFESNTVKEVGGIFTIIGPAINPKIELNDCEMFYNNTLLEGQKLLIDSTKSTITLVNANGNKSNAMEYYNHKFPKIQNGINTLEVKSGITNVNQLILNWYDLKF